MFDNEFPNNAKCPHCGYTHFVSYASAEEFDQETLDKSGGYMPIFCDACDALPMELLEESQLKDTAGMLWASLVRKEMYK